MSLQCRRLIRKVSWRKEWLSTWVFLPGEFHRERSLEGYSPWGVIGSDMTKWLHLRPPSCCLHDSMSKCNCSLEGHPAFPTTRMLHLHWCLVAIYTNLIYSLFLVLSSTMRNPELQFIPFLPNSYSSYARCEPIFHSSLKLFKYFPHVLVTCSVVNLHVLL